MRKMEFIADRHLVGLRSRKFNTAKWGDMEFANDTAIVSTSKGKMTHAINTLFPVIKQWGLTVSASKTIRQWLCLVHYWSYSSLVLQLRLKRWMSSSTLGSVLHLDG